MLIKARVSAGDRSLGDELLDEVEPLIYSSTLDFKVVEAASETRERIGEKLAARRGASQGFNIKLAPGGIRDIEFLVQCLQRLHGGRDRWVRHGGTLLALSRLRDKNLLSATEYWRLASAYQFLRHLEHRLQFARRPPDAHVALGPRRTAALARKLPGRISERPSAESLLGLVNRHLEEVREIYEGSFTPSSPCTTRLHPCLLTPAGPRSRSSRSSREPATSSVFSTNARRS